MRPPRPARVRSVRWSDGRPRRRGENVFTGACSTRLDARLAPAHRLFEPGDTCAAVPPSPSTRPRHSRPMCSRRKPQWDYPTSGPRWKWPIEGATITTSQLAPKPRLRCSVGRVESDCRRQLGTRRQSCRRTEYEQTDAALTVVVEVDTALGGSPLGTVTVESGK